MNVSPKHILLVAAVLALTAATANASAPQSISDMADPATAISFNVKDGTVFRTSDLMVAVVVSPCPSIPLRIFLDSQPVTIVPKLSILPNQLLYSFSFRSLREGSHTLHAELTDNVPAHSATVIFTVTLTPSGDACDSDAQCVEGFCVGAEAGNRYCSNFNDAVVDDDRSAGCASSGQPSSAGSILGKNFGAHTNAALRMIASMQLQLPLPNISRISAVLAVAYARDHEFSAAQLKSTFCEQ
jgi:hypothetical protein